MRNELFHSKERYLFAWTFLTVDKKDFAPNFSTCKNISREQEVWEAKTLHIAELTL